MEISLLEVHSFQDTGWGAKKCTQPGIGKDWFSLLASERKRQTGRIAWQETTSRWMEPRAIWKAQPAQCLEFWDIHLMKKTRTVQVCFIPKEEKWDEMQRNQSCICADHDADDFSAPASS